jgi:hypothetical protein
VNFKLKSTTYDRPEVSEQIGHEKSELGNYCVCTLKLCYSLALSLEIVVTCIQNEYGAEQKRIINRA